MGLVYGPDMRYIYKSLTFSIAFLRGFLLGQCTVKQSREVKLRQRGVEQLHCSKQNGTVMDSVKYKTSAVW